MEEFMITSRHIVDDVRAITERFEELVDGTRLDLEQVKNFTEINHPGKVFYFDERLNRKDQEEKDSLYCWIDTGYVTEKKEPIFISLLHHDDYYSGHFVGTAKYLAKGIWVRNIYLTNAVQKNLKKFEKKYIHILDKRKNEITYVSTTSGTDQAKAETAIQQSVQEILPIKTDSLKKDNSLSAVTEEIFSELLLPTWKSIDGLDRYIKVIGRRIPQLIEAGKSQYYLMNSIGDVVVNTGMLNKYRNDVLVLYKKSLSRTEYVPGRLMSGRASFIDERFSREQSQKQECIDSITFLDEGIKFDAVKEDFDLNTRCLMHIVEERRERFPETIQNKSLDQIAQAVERELEQGIRIQRRDHSYVKPIYTDGKISWLMPFRVEAKLTEEPELVLVIRKNGEFYEVKTILPYDDHIKDKITSLSLYRQFW